MVYRTYLKPFFDLLVTCLAILFFFPVFILLTLLLFFVNKGHPFFIQRRVGKNEKIFYCVKFRTMTTEKDSKGDLLPDVKRITRIGNFIRKTSLDEIPQLFNILKGEMSLVGPRPLLVDYLPLYNDFQKRRHEVNQGITGWAQVNGRNAITWDEKFALDVWYVDNISFKLDLKIIFLTIKKVFNSEDIDSSSENTMERFVG